MKYTKFLNIRRIFVFCIFTHLFIFISQFSGIGKILFWLLKK